MARYRLSPAAVVDLEAIWTYTSQKWGEDQADRYIDLLTHAFTELARSPATAPTCDHIRLGYRRRRVERHMIYFRVTNDGITVVRILHDRMDAARHL